LLIEWLTLSWKEDEHMTLTKADIVESINNQLGFQKNHSADIVEILLEIIKESLEFGEDALISGFGKFCVQKKGKRRVTCSHSLTIFPAHMTRVFVSDYLYGLLSSVFPAKGDSAVGNSPQNGTIRHG